MDKVLERIKRQIEKHTDDENVLVNGYDLLKLVQEYEIEIGIKNRWNDERWD